MIIFKDDDETILTAAVTVLSVRIHPENYPFLTITYIAGQMADEIELVLDYTDAKLCRADYKRLLDCCV